MTMPRTFRDKCPGARNLQRGSSSVPMEKLAPEACIPSSTKELAIGKECEHTVYLL
jgi:hypothetical protein